MPDVDATSVPRVKKTSCKSHEHVVNKSETRGEQVLGKFVVRLINDFSRSDRKDLLGHDLSLTILYITAKLLTYI